LDQNSGGNTVSSGGGIVGNGGDSVRCVPSPDNFLEGYYNLDYVLTLANFKDDDQLVPVISWQDSKQRLAALIHEKIPELELSFSNFVESLAGVDKTAPTSHREWIPVQGGLVTLRDEGNTSRVPRNCWRGSFLNDMGELFLIQTVVRREKPEAIEYWYRDFITQKFLAKNPSQFSFLVIHEWLWDFTLNAEVNRRVNRFFHSSDFETMTSAQVHSRLQQIGLQLP
jgi:hypothetical protein